MVCSVSCSLSKVITLSIWQGIARPIGGIGFDGFPVMAQLLNSVASVADISIDLATGFKLDIIAFVLPYALFPEPILAVPQ